MELLTSYLPLVLLSFGVVFAAYFLGRHLVTKALPLDSKDDDVIKRRTASLARLMLARNLACYLLLALFGFSTFLTLRLGDSQTQMPAHVLPDPNYERTPVPPASESSDHVRDRRAMERAQQETDETVKLWLEKVKEVREHSETFQD